MLVAEALAQTSVALPLALTNHNGYEINQFSETTNLSDTLQDDVKQIKLGTADEKQLLPECNKQRNTQIKYNHDHLSNMFRNE
jgi:hypothetical protein